jgi:hypothetical protein
MFKNFIKNLFKEPTNVADISPVTFNSPGTYNPRYGKAKVKFVGRGGSGSYSPGYLTGYYNTSTQNVNQTTNYISDVTFVGHASIIAYTANGVVAYTDSVNSNPGSIGAQAATGATTNSGNWGLYYSWPNATPAAAINTSSVWTITYTNNGNSSIVFTPGYSNSNFPNGGRLDQTISVNVASAVPPISIVLGGNPGNWNPSTFVPTGYQPESAYTGAAYTFDGISVPGGYGGQATDISMVSLPYRDLWLSTTVTIPSGGYATINFSL